MPRTNRPPAYRLQKARQCAVVTIHGKDHYLGPYGSPESHEKYARIIARWNSASKQVPSAAVLPVTNGSVQVNLIILMYLEFAAGYYKKNGESTGEINNIRSALSTLKKLYGRSPAKDFGPKDLELVRQAMIDAKLARKTINGRIGRIKRMFRWATKEDLVPGNTYYSLMAVDGLKRGRSAAKETSPVRPVSEEDVRKTCEHLNPYVRAMVQVEELTGMRPQEIRNLRSGDIDFHGDVWIYTPWTHKTEHHGHVRQIAIGPKAQVILQPFLNPKQPLTYLFSPAAAVRRVREERAKKRKTRRQPSQLNRRKQAPRRKPDEQYTKCSYRRAVNRACKKAKVPSWHPNQLRHSCGTKVRRLYGLDGAAAVLGHRLGTVTEIYAEADLQKAINIVRDWISDR